ncbi:hypothetical protein CLIB1423_04S02388 [[Candida] railenensis]|uniref:Uncharacterized protein n=1 Tax=[Candida] railenensis TaxID=45579 RepID=A0A9P0QNH3_9ASCO|nr:hypothetical protein CLIB1423_04S02388 [[Candida] railenensis]
MDRLSMLYSHVKETSAKEIAQEFPKLARYERQKWEATDFHTAFFKSARVPSTVSQSISTAIRQSPSIIELRSEKADKVYIPRFAGNAPRRKEFGAEESKTVKDMREYLGGGLQDRVLITKKRIFEEDDLQTLRISSVDELKEGKLEKDINASVVVVLSHADCSMGSLLSVESVVSDIRRIKSDITIALNITESIGNKDIQFQKWGVDIAYADVNADATLAIAKEGVDTTNWQATDDDNEMLIDELGKLWAVKGKLSSAENVLGDNENSDVEDEIAEFRAQLAEMAIKDAENDSTVTVVKSSDGRSDVGGIWH